MKMKSASQILYNRIVATWITPELKQRAVQDKSILPFDLRAALIIWIDLSQPEIFLNDEIKEKIEEIQVDVINAKNDHPLPQENIYGLRGIKLKKILRNKPFIFFIKGNHGKYFVNSQKASNILQTKDFDILKHQLESEGVYLITQKIEERLFIDSIKSLYESFPNPASKRKWTIELADIFVESKRKKALECIRRQLKLPSILVPQDNDLLPLLLETRQTYIEGHFFSTIAAAATTSDRICIKLSQHYKLSKPIHKWLIEQTLGNKIPKLQKIGVITPEQADLLFQINKIRNRHIHPKKTVNSLTLKKDAFKIVLLLHQLVEGTFSVYEDHTFEQGIIVPKPFN